VFTNIIKPINNNMKKKHFDIIVILIITVFLVSLEISGLLEESAKFMVVPFYLFYYLGQYSERKFK
jgi:ABC-type transport system involved in multi-copper enzyme maturation permease subunit